MTVLSMDVQWVAEKIAFVTFITFTLGVMGLAIHHIIFEKKIS